MNNATNLAEPTTADILRWFDDAGLAVIAVQSADCATCATPAAA